MRSNIAKVIFPAMRKIEDIIIRDFSEADRLRLSKNAESLNEYIAVTYKKIEEVIISDINRSLPEYAINDHFTDDFKDENKKTEENNYRWLICPIDGVINYYNGIPDFTTIISLFKDEKPFFTIINSYYTREIFWSEVGVGSYISNSINNLKLRIVDTVGNKKIMFSNTKVKLPGFYSRNMGCKSLEIAYLANNRGVIALYNIPKDSDKKLKDILDASSLLVSEGGGLSIMRDNYLIISNPITCRKVTELISK